MARTRTEEREYIPQQIRWQVFHDCEETCAHCGKPLSFRGNFTLEHVIPLSKGGSNDMSNYVALCHDCNVEKNNDIIDPDEYYTHLPKDKKHALKELFNNYMQSTDWLSYNTLFRLDRFNLSINITHRNPRTGKPMLIPSTVRVEKMRTEAILDYLLSYGGRLNLYDKQMIAYSEEQLDTDYYRVTRGETTVMVLSPYIRTSDATTVFHPTVENRTLLYLDVFCNPDLHIRSQDTLDMLYSILLNTLKEISTTLRSPSGYSTIECVIRTMASDKITSLLFKHAELRQPEAIAPFTARQDGDEKLEDAPTIRGLNLVLFQGPHREMKRVMEEAGTPDDLVQFVNNGHIEAYQNSIHDRLSNSKEKTPMVIEKKKKVNPKAKGRKKNGKVVKRKSMKQK